MLETENCDYSGYSYCSDEQTSQEHYQQSQKAAAEPEPPPKQGFATQKALLQKDMDACSPQHADDD
jgi:hypothetical protein